MAVPVFINHQLIVANKNDHVGPFDWSTMRQIKIDTNTQLQIDTNTQIKCLTAVKKNIALGTPLPSQLEA